MKRRREDNLRHDSQHQRHAGIMRQAKLAESRKDNPKREEWMLRQAVDRVGLKVVDYEYFHYPHNYDVAVEINGQLAFVDLIPEWNGSVRKRDRAVMQSKNTQCEDDAIPLCWVRPGSLTEMQAEIEVWSMFR